MDNVDLTVKNIQVQDTTEATPKGTFEPMRRVTFFVGDHGPFVKQYTRAEATPARIKSDIQAEVEGLRSIHELGS